MICVKMMSNGDIAVLDNGHVYLFNKMGKCIGEDIGDLSRYGGSTVKMPVISFLTSNGVLDVALFFGDGSMKRYTSSETPMNHVIHTQMQGGFIKMLNRSGKMNLNGEQVLYNQLIFLYKSGTDITSKISKGLKEVAS